MKSKKWKIIEKGVMWFVAFSLLSTSVRALQPYLPYIAFGVPLIYLWYKLQEFSLAMFGVSLVAAYYDPRFLILAVFPFIMKGLFKANKKQLA